MPSLKEFLLYILPWIIAPPVAIAAWSAIYRRRHPPTTEQLEAAAALRDSRWLPSGWAALSFAFVYAGTLWLRKLSFVPQVAKGPLLILPVATLAWFGVVFFRERRNGGELERSIQGEACVHAIWTFLFWPMGMWLMFAIWPAPSHEAFSGGLFLPLFYFVALFTAKAKLYPKERFTHER